MKADTLEEAGIKIDPQDIYGHGFHDAVILIITAEEDTAGRLLRITRHGGEDLLILPCEPAPDAELPVPTQIYLRTPESWYMCKTAEFRWRRTDAGLSASFLVYKIKAQYMASAALADYTVLCTGHSDADTLFLLQRNSQRPL
ncbi:MAG: hypothetical protein IKG46_08275 [Solobacterium sp.]|nr:hypothetical protein [Solobacterium sp.]